MRLNGVNIGDLDKKFTVEEPTFANNSVTSEQTPTWSTFGYSWGRWMNNSMETFEANQQVALNQSKILIRYLSGLTETMRLNDNGTYYYIKGIDKNDRNVTQLLTVEKRNNV